MAVTPVSLGPGLRAWALAGVTHILCDGEVDAIFYGNAPQAHSAAIPHEASRPLPATPPSAHAGPGAVRPEPQGITVASHSLGPAQPVPEAARESAPPGPPGGLAFAPCAAGMADPAAWPASWAGWFAKIAPAPVLWTYHELGADLTGLGRSPERSRFFRDLIGELRLPKGSSVFWPSAMPVAEQEGHAYPKAEPEIFAVGVTRLMPRIVVVFGERALEDIGLGGRIHTLRQEMVEGKLVLCLPEIAALLHDPKQRVRAVSLLRAVLGSVNFG